MYDLICKKCRRLVRIFWDTYDSIISVEEEEQIQLVKEINAIKQIRGSYK